MPPSLPLLSPGTTFGFWVRERWDEEVHHAAQGIKRILVGQIHSHDRSYGVDLSWVDIKYGLSVPYYLSVVAPDYALNPETVWDDCGTHIYLGNPPGSSTVNK